MIVVVLARVLLVSGGHAPGMILGLHMVAAEPSPEPGRPPRDRRTCRGVERPRWSGLSSLVAEVGGGQAHGMTSLGSRGPRGRHPNSSAPVSERSDPLLQFAGADDEPVAGRWLLLSLAGFGLLAVVGGVVMVAGGSPVSPDRGLGVIAAILAMTSLAATVAYLAVFASLHVLPTGFSPVRHAVSDYAVGRYAPLFRAGLYVSSVAVLLLAFALIRGVGSPPLASRDVVYLLLIPVARIGMTLFPTSLEGERLTRSAVVHYLCAIAAFTLTYLVISEMTVNLRNLDPASWLDNPLRWTAWAVAPELVLVMVTMLRPLRRIFGVFERLFLLTTNIWFLLVAMVVIDVVG
ncbi:hypothetical protein ABIB25_005247 [Nakamurella sp. UYEF19]|uniref:DUF998 domain-containing protein n=1 Tax=Nakamurella sp. UYEF19 TaxID=1756392 RepID=UPI003391F799